MKIPQAIYAALSSDTNITQYLGEFNGNPSVHTKRPVPPNAGYPMIVSASDVTIGNEDFLNTPNPTVVRDIIVYALQDGDYRKVENCAYAIRQKFHRNRFALSVEEYGVMDIVASGPISGPIEDEAHVSRIVTLTIRLRKT